LHDEQTHFCDCLLTGAAASLIPLADGRKCKLQKRRVTVVLCMGCSPTASSWYRRDFHVAGGGLMKTSHSVQHPWTTLPEAVSPVSPSGGVLARQEPTVLVGPFLLRHDRHGGGGIRTSRRSSSCWPARGRTAGEDYKALAKPYPGRGGQCRHSVRRRAEDAFRRCFLRGLRRQLQEAKAKVLYAVQEPFHKALSPARTRTRPGGSQAQQHSYYARFHGRPAHQSGP